MVAVNFAEMPPAADLEFSVQTRIAFFSVPDLLDLADHQVGCDRAVADDHCFRAKAEHCAVTAEGIGDSELGAAFRKLGSAESPPESPPGV